MITTVQEILGREEKVISYASPEDSLVKRIIINSIELSTGRRRVEKAYQALKSLGINDARVWSHVFPFLDIQLRFNEEALDQIPSSGPTILIANHPYGVADGMALGYTLSRRREDFLLIVNGVLCREKVLGKYFLPIDFREHREALMTNIATRKKAISHLKNGGAIGIFPSGGVSTTPKLLSRKAQDLDWKKFVNKLVRTSGADVIPVFFKGQNSRAFQVASHIHANVRLALLLNELDRKKGKEIEFIIGDRMRHEHLERVHREDLLPYLKKKTFELCHE